MKKRFRCKVGILGIAVLGTTVLVLGTSASADPAVPTPVGLGSATNAAVISAGGPTQNGTSAITGDVSSTTPSQPGFGQCGIPDCVNYTAGSGQHINDGVAITDQADALLAFNHINNDLTGATPIGPELGGLVLPAGLYDVGAADITGVLTFNAAFNPNSVWIFRASSTITANPGSSFNFINTGSASLASLECNVYWTSVLATTLNGGGGTGPQLPFVGTVLAGSGVGLVGSAGVNVTGRVAAVTSGSVTLAGNDTINRGSCPELVAGTGGTPATTSGGTGATGGGATGGGASTTSAFTASPATAITAAPSATGLAG